MRPFSTLSPSLPRSAGSTVSEPIIATATTIIVPIEKDMNVLSPERNMPAIAIRTVMPEIEDGAAGGGCGGLEGGVLASPGRTLFTFTPEVEERVVDADGEADQQDHFGDRFVDGDELAGQRDQSRGRDDRGDRQEQWDERGNGGAEDEQQDHERQRQRDHAGRLEHAVERVVDSLARAGAAELVDLEGRMPGCGLVDGGLDRLDVEDGLLVGALGAELHHRRVAVVRDLIGVTSLERRVELANLRHRVERLGDVLDRGLERRIARFQGLGLDQDDLALLVGGTAGSRRR